TSTFGFWSLAALASLEKQLMCPICLEIFNKPVVILPCQHNLCRKCANELYQARTTMMVNSGRFRCPSCRHEVVLDRHGVYGLQRNLLVENIIDVYKQEVSGCTSREQCLHLEVSSPLAPCSDHEAEKVNIYCLTCQVPTCSLCKVFGAHQTCQVAPLTDVYQQRKDELNEELRAVGTFNNKVQSLIDGLEETCRTIEVCVFSLYGKLLKVRAVLTLKAMAQQISDEQDEKTAHVLALARCYGDRVEANNKLRPPSAFMSVQATPLQLCTRIIRWVKISATKSYSILHVELFTVDVEQTVDISAAELTLLCWASGSLAAHVDWQHEKAEARNLLADADRRF
uniref:Tripartite motif containing 101 n=1 Tax=Salarias fasciatus TaxID=181472 RepID=A0A672HSJ2_SALFA